MTRISSSVRAVLAAAACAPCAAQAFDFSIGGWSASLNSTVTYGHMWRDESRDLRLIGTADCGGFHAGRYRKVRHPLT